MKEKTVEIIEVFMKVEKGKEDVYGFLNNEYLKQVAILANGKVIKLEKGFYIEKRRTNLNDINL